ncbi:cell envelope integrity protein TolA [Halodesulfovibrio marinisediminis]|uniref:Cell division and transport-associated protein TolA n=1 Tax=Halodesulfovibrio marinisediminis DSM 17456 TaxID=1121457 RepID=A0A1N6EZC4_9BACT|nr:cell envelope integrity protein TolA [Halodesulfovibrio marinisediminis]SIN88339.1 Cell division and transport-associated protein TolA [Halodesulfovibrio marinisediminis DSM 17456]
MRFLSMLFSLCLHLGLIVAILYWPASTLKVRLDVPVYKVKLVQLAQKAPKPRPNHSNTVVKEAKLQKEAPKKEAPAKEAPKKEAPKQEAPKQKAPAKAKPKPKAKPVSVKKKEQPKKAVTKKKKPPKKEAVKKANTKEKPQKKKAKKKTPPKPTPEELLQKALASSKAAVKKDNQKKAHDLEKELAALQKAVAKEDAKKAEQGIEGTPQDGVVGSIEDLYALTVMDAIRPNWRYPKLATRTTLVAQVRIMISNSGEILDAKLLNSSGRPDFDSSTLRAIADTEQLPTPPNPDLNEITLNFNSQED